MSLIREMKPSGRWFTHTMIVCGFVLLIVGMLVTYGGIHQEETWKSMLGGALLAGSWVATFLAGAYTVRDLTRARSLDDRRDRDKNYDEVNKAGGGPMIAS